MSRAGQLLLGVSVALTPPVVDRPDDEFLRKALYRYAFNPTSDISEAPAEMTAAFEWLTKHSVPITDLDASPLLGKVTDAIAINLDGAPAATSTFMRKRAVLHGCLQYVVERGHFAVNPLHAFPRRRLPRAAGVDRRVVVNPDQARSLLSTIRRLDTELEAFFARTDGTSDRSAWVGSHSWLNRHIR